MSVDLTIDGTSVYTLGFTLKSARLTAVGEPKKQGGGTDVYTSVNYNLSGIYENSPVGVIELFGRFDGQAATDSAIYTLYGMLIQPGAHIFTHVNGDYNESMTGIMHKGGKGNVKREASGRIVVELRIEILKTNEQWDN